MISINLRDSCRKGSAIFRDCCHSDASQKRFASVSPGIVAGNIVIRIPWPNGKGWRSESAPGRGIKSAGTIKRVRKVAKKQTRRNVSPSGSEYKHGSALPKKARCDASTSERTGPTILVNRCHHLLTKILRKEVIQPQVPLRLPCYDLVPIAEFRFGACLP